MFREEHHSDVKRSNVNDTNNILRSRQNHSGPFSGRHRVFPREMQLIGVQNRLDSCFVLLVSPLVSACECSTFVVHRNEWWSIDQCWSMCLSRAFRDRLSQALSVKAIDGNRCDRNRPFQWHPWTSPVVENRTCLQGFVAHRTECEILVIAVIYLFSWLEVDAMRGFSEMKEIDLNIIDDTCCERSLQRSKLPRTSF